MRLFGCFPQFVSWTLPWSLTDSQHQVVGVPKMSAQDNILTTENAAGEIKSIPIPKGTYVTLDVPALHFNSA
jgi:hypothetical protein